MAYSGVQGRRGRRVALLLLRLEDVDMARSPVEVRLEVLRPAPIDLQGEVPSVVPSRRLYSAC